VSSSFRTLRQGQEATAEIERRRSRFIAQFQQVRGEREAKSYEQKVRSRHRDARHNVCAWVLSGGQKHCSDDGEPQHTAGPPVLDALCGAGLADVCCVVTRYFGGTLLGPGGLVRAYARATEQAILAGEQAGLLITMELVTPVTCAVPYSAYGRVEHLVKACSGKVSDVIFSEDVQLNCLFRTGDEDRFVSLIRDLAAGEDLCKLGNPRFGEFRHGG
jgi:uncharacterized YigZ family protein